MTNEEAIKQIDDLKQYLNRSTAWYLNDKHKTALDMAIFALKESRPKGEWDVNCQGIVFCSKCKKVINHNYDIDYMESHFNFCPNCGADMRGEV